MDFIIQSLEEPSMSIEDDETSEGELENANLSHIDEENENETLTHDVQRQLLRLMHQRRNFHMNHLMIQAIHIFFKICQQMMIFS